MMTLETAAFFRAIRLKAQKSSEIGASRGGSLSTQRCGTGTLAGPGKLYGNSVTIIDTISRNFGRQSRVLQIITCDCAMLLNTSHLRGNLAQ
jgi:hypothetical protein